ncbi:hypothetical protein EEL31_11880 [Brevibacillus laterosporus]|nr:hypothetical protein [Brevibacillus laterosporus]TPG69167.1 hypothetical protein EEL31_11880 [Brevibacillus laterosporus]
MKKKHYKHRHYHYHHYYHHRHEERSESRREERSEFVQNEFRSIQPSEDRENHRHVTVIINPGETLVVHARDSRRSR